MICSTRSFRGVAISALTRVFDALWRRTRNPDKAPECGTGFRVHALRACPGMTRSIATIASAAAILSATPVIAQDAYPNRPVRLVVGFGAGGPTDIPARHIADKLGNLIGQRIIVENKMGAAGMLATRDVLAQPAGRLQPAALHAFRIDQHGALQESGLQALRPRADLADRAGYYYGLARRQRRAGRELRAARWQFAKAHPGEISYANAGRLDRRRKSWRGRSRSSPASR